MQSGQYFDKEKKKKIDVFRYYMKDFRKLKFL